jgi:hypothetical protein
MIFRNKKPTIVLDTDRLSPAQSRCTKCGQLIFKAEPVTVVGGGHGKLAFFHTSCYALRDKPVFEISRP